MSAGRASRASWLERALPCALALAAAVTFANGARGPFLFDDARFAMDDPPGFWMRPVLWWTVLFNRALDHWSGRVDTLGYHIFNVVGHTLAGLVLYCLLRRTLALLPAWREPLERSLFSFAVALVWLVHPLQTESVTYLSGRSESLAGLCYLSTLYCFARSTTSARPRGWLALALAAFVIGMGVKELVATAPVLVLLYDRAFLSASFAQAWRRRPVFYAALFLADLVLSAVLIVPQLLQENSTAGFGVATSGAWEYLRTQSGVLLHYLALGSWPSELCLDYQWPIAREAREFVPHSIAVLALLGATLWGLIRGSRLAFLGAWFFVILAPTSSFVPQQDPACDRRMYLPLAAVVVLVLAGAWRLARAGAARQLVPLAASLVLAAVLGLATIRRNELYRSPVAMWQDVVARAPHNWRAHLSLGIVLMEAGRLDESVEALERSLAISPRPNAYLQLAVVQERRQRLDLAIAAYDGADALRPEHAETLQQRGIAHLENGSADRAHADLERAFALAPTSLTQIQLGIADLEREVWSEAESHFGAALELDPDSARARGGLGRALFQEQRHAQALPELEAALLAAPDDQDLHTLIGACLSALGRPEEALAHHRRAIEILPDAAEEHFNLGRALGDLARHDEAARELRRAVALAPGKAQMLELLARTLLAKPEATAEERSEALAAALEAARLTQHSRPRVLETLASAQAANGDRTRARETLERAALLVPPGDAELRQRLAARLAEYER